MIRRRGKNRRMCPIRRAKRAWNAYLVTHPYWQRIPRGGVCDTSGGGRDETERGVPGGHAL